MATGEIAEYLSATTADYTTTQLDISPQEVMVETGKFNQVRKRLDDGTPKVLTRSATPQFLFRVKWNYLSEADANTIYDMYFDTAKAYGSGRSIEFPHPTETNTYIVRFWSEISREIRYLRGIAEIELLIEGYKA